MRPCTAFTVDNSSLLPLEGAEGNTLQLTLDQREPVADVMKRILEHFQDQLPQGLKPCLHRLKVHNWGREKKRAGGGGVGGGRKKKNQKKKKQKREREERGKGGKEKERGGGGGGGGGQRENKTRKEAKRAA